MKKQSGKTKKKKGSRQKSSAPKGKARPESRAEPAPRKPALERAAAVPQKRTVERKGDGGRSPGAYVGKGIRFLREARMELKKVKWPTRKELLASTAVVIVLTLVVAFFLGLVDFGLIKIMRTIVG